jgi:hypothetical protein
MKNRMLIVFVDASHAEDVEKILNEYEVLGYSEIGGVLGKGATGRKLASRAFPGSSTCFMAAVTEPCARELTERLGALFGAKGVEEGLKLFSLNVDELI